MELLEHQDQLEHLYVFLLFRALMVSCNRVLLVVLEQLDCLELLDVM